LADPPINKPIISKTWKNAYEISNKKNTDKYHDKELIVRKGSQ
jgi:hypothetical protein